MCRREYEKAVADYNEAIRLDPKDAAPHNNLALVYGIGRGEDDKAIAELNEAIRLNPSTSTPITTGAGPTCARASMTRPSQISMRPSGWIKNARAYGNRADAYRKKGEFYKAAVDRIKAEELSDNRNRASDSSSPLR